VDQVASPIRLDGRAGVAPTPPPLLGEHSREILSEAGYSDSEIGRLAAEGVV
jgi:crotonobetainyl-CoA:carnitine CoA-transferase CaiB-like acyl-CoA transferase